MKKLVVLGCLSLFLYSCTSNTIYEKPKDLIPKDSMILILKDLHLATSARTNKNKNNYRRISYIPLVYNKFKIDSLRFKNSSLYYTSKVDVYQPMLNEVLLQLQKEQSIIALLKKNQDSILQDSIKKSRSRIVKTLKRGEKDLKKLPVLMEKD